jgi:alkylation response protein AidB-like acyl-CoA dehydrogenase
MIDEIDDEFLRVATGAMHGSNGSTALDALGWWELVADVEDAEARAAVFATFRAQGRELASTNALGALMAAPFVAGTEAAAGRIVAAIPRRSPRRGRVWVVIGQVGEESFLFDEPGTGTYVIEGDAVRLQPIDVAGRLNMHELSVDLGAHRPWLDEGRADAVRGRSLSLGRVAAACEILGAAERAVDLAIEHAENREQFAQPIAAFQAVRHLLAWAKTDCVAIDSAVHTALRLLDRLPERFDEVVKALAGRNGRHACERSLQVLGAIGFTAEHDHHHHHSRVLALDSLLGSSIELTQRLGAWLRDGGNDPRFPSAVLVPETGR